MNEIKTHAHLGEMAHLAAQSHFEKDFDTISTIKSLLADVHDLHQDAYKIYLLVKLLCELEEIKDKTYFTRQTIDHVVWSLKDLSRSIKFKA